MATRFLLLLSSPFALLLAFLPATLPGAESDGQDDRYPILAATDTGALKAKDGQKVVVWGTTEGSGKSQSGTNFVNFEGAQFYLITFKSDLDPFQDAEPADAYDKKRLVVTGVVSVYKDKPQIKLTHPDQVQILKEDEAWPQTPAPDSDDSDSATAAEKTPSKTETATPEEPKKKPPVDPKLYFK